MRIDELEIRIHDRPALTLSVQSARAGHIEAHESWPNLSIAWETPPSRLYTELWLDACLPENGNREPYAARAASQLLQLRIEGPLNEPSTMTWANPDAEYPGAVTFASGCHTTRAPGYEALTETEISERLYETWRVANNAHKGAPADYPERRTSLSGMRGKFGMALREGRWCTAHGHALTNWIAKREDSDRLRGEAGIESLSQEAMALVGVPAATTRSRVFGDQQCVLSERADRTVDTRGRIVSLHQEDFAQTTAWPPGQKYDSGTRDEPRWKAAYALLREHGADPETETAKLTRMLAAAWMLGHCDLHRRNLGFSHLDTEDGRRIRLAPMYDVSSAIDTYLDQRLAIGIARQEALSKIGPRQWLEHAHDCHLDPEATLQIVREVARDTAPAIAAARETVRGRDENRYQAAVDRRADAMIRYAHTRARIFNEQTARIGHGQPGAAEKQRARPK